MQGFINFFKTLDYEFFLEYSFLGRTVYQYLIAFLIFLFVIVALKIFKSIVLKKIVKYSQKTDTDLDDEIIQIIESFPRYFYWTVYIYVPLKYLDFWGMFWKIIDWLFVLVVLLEVIKIWIRVVAFFLWKLLLSDKSKKSDRTTYNLFMLLSKIVIWALAAMIFLMNIWVEITPLIAGLWIWWVAVAFAMQNILEDIFSAFSIYLDKPFNIWDYILIWTDSGVVKKVGIKTSRIQTLQWEELVIANKELTSARINNFGIMQKRRVSFEFWVVYETSVEKLKKIKEIVHSICEEKSGEIELDRVHFKSFWDFSLIYEVVYHVQVSDYSTYMDMQEFLNFRIMEEFEKESIEFAYPTRKILTQNIE